MKKLLQALKRDERGVSAIEYAILAGVIVVIVAVGVAGFGEDITALFDNASDALGDAVTASESAGGGGGGSGGQ